MHQLDYLSVKFNNWINNLNTRLFIVTMPIKWSMKGYSDLKSIGIGDDRG